jgi:hypothetical protein
MFNVMRSFKLWVDMEQILDEQEQHKNAIKLMDYIGDVLLFCPSPRYKRLVMEKVFVSCEGL